MEINSADLFKLIGEQQYKIEVLLEELRKRDKELSSLNENVQGKDGKVKEAKDA